LAEEADQPLDVLGHRGQEELLSHKLQSPQAQATQPDLILQFREQGFHFLSLPLGMGELWRVRQVPGALPGWSMLVDDQTPEGGTGAVWSERARTTTLAGPYVGIGTVPMTKAAVIEGLACGTDITVAFGLIGEALGTVEWAVLSVDTVAGSHIGSDAPICQPLQTPRSRTSASD
jgi:hypothetical protein